MKLHHLVVAVILLAAASLAQAAAVNVTVSATKTFINVGETTTFDVYGQVTTADATAGNGIFGWDVDLHVQDPTILQLLTGTVDRSGWTGTPATSSSGTAMSWGLHAIYDTGEGSSSLGLSAPIQLFSIQITGLKQGTTTLSIQADTTTGADFVTWGSMTGGDYSKASLNIVTPEPATLSLVVLGAIALLRRRRC